MPNSCPIKLDGAAITVRLNANNGIRAAAVFYLGKPKPSGGYTIEETHKLTTGNAGEDQVTLATSSELLMNFALAWDINACSMIDQAESGNVKIALYQQGKKLKTTSPTSYYGSFPNCSAGSHRNMKNEIIFIEGAAPQIDSIWTSI